MEPVMIGVLLDVSESMKQSTGEGTDTEDMEWARSIFTTIDNLIKNDLKSSNYIFAIGFGAKHDPYVFDLLGSINVKRIYPDDLLWDVVDKILSILETNGARNVRKWALKNTLMDALKGQEYKCDRILENLQRDSDFVQYVVNDCLPSACRDYNENDVKNLSNTAFGACVEAAVGGSSFAVPLFVTAGLLFALPSSVTTPLANEMNSMGSSAATCVVTATNEDIDDVVDKIEKKMVIRLKRVSDGSGSVYEVCAAHEILRGHVGDENELTKQRIDELMDKVRPYIYGRTPLYEALGMSAKLFSHPDYRQHKKLLFVLSDGQPTDESDRWSMVSDLSIKPSDVTTVGCFISSSSKLDPYILYSSGTNTQQWKHDAKFMFDLSSTMLTQNVPRTIFVNRKWKVEMINNETRLFLQVNHPDHLKDACDFAREVVTSQEALSDVLASVDLDIYINRSNAEAFKPQNQGEKPTCYAYASATVMHLAMNRILGRDGGVPDFASLRDEMINCYSKQPGGEQGADTEVVLKEMCRRPQYNLRYKKVDKRGAMEAIMEKRPVVARFRLIESEMKKFQTFFENNKTGVLTSNDVDVHKRIPDTKIMGHAVVLISFNSKSLRFMNSWGTKWGDGGFFNVQDADVLDFEFFDVYWNEDDLTQKEKADYAAHGSKVADELMKALIGLQESTYECPLCKFTSKVTEFEGHLSSVTCPNCKDIFKCDTKQPNGNILALNIYLTSLSHKDTKQMLLSAI